MVATYKVKGSTTDITRCELCGRDDLRGTTVLAVLDTEGTETGEYVHAGSDCAARATGTTARKIRDAAAAGDRDQAAAADRARRIISRYEDVDGLLPRDAVLRYVDANWRHTSGMTGDEILVELRALVADARRVLGLDKPSAAALTPGFGDTDTTEETPVKATTAPLFDVLPLLGQTTVEDQVADALAEQAAAVPAVEAAPEPLGDGSLFALRVTDTPDITTGALFGLGI